MIYKFILIHLNKIKKRNEVSYMHPFLAGFAKVCFGYKLVSGNSQTNNDFMNNYKITKDQLETAQQFFRESSINVLTTVSTRINKEQPNFTAVLLALEMHGLDRNSVENLLESIFIIYYIQTDLNKKSIPTISTGQVVKNINGFGQFIEYYNQEKSDDSSDLSQIKFLRDQIVLNFAVETLHKLFGDVKNIPKEVTFGYLGLLKGIEMGADKS